jgi:hypothetical protein
VRTIFGMFANSRIFIDARPTPTTISLSLCRLVPLIGA